MPAGRYHSVGIRFVSTWSPVDFLNLVVVPWAWATSSAAGKPNLFFLSPFMRVCCVVVWESNESFGEARLIDSTVKGYRGVR